MDEKKQPPIIDLHESEWKREGKHEPILGPNGRYFITLALLAIPINIAATWIVTGSFPVWLVSLLQ